MASENLDLAAVVLATGALGTAAFGVVEGLKWTPLGHSGFAKIEETFGKGLMAALAVAYGPECQRLLKAQYSKGRSGGDLPRTLRQGVRIGMTPDNVEDMASQVGVVDGQGLRAVAEKLQQGKELSDDDKNLLARFELAVDARIDAALALAERSYRGWIRVSASAAAIILALIAAKALDPTSPQWALAFIVGVAAVPLAPIAKDVSNALQSAAKAIRAKK